MSVSFPVKVYFPADSSWANLNGTRTPTFAWSAILRAAMVAGYPDLSSIPSPQFARWRTAALRLALPRSGGQLIQPPEWALLDQSEKAAVSSLLGVVVTKLLVERLLNAPLLLFLGVYFTLTFPPGVEKVRPDFAAMTPSGDWFSVEAKGKSRFRQATLENGKTQAGALGTVNGQAVETAIVCVTSFRGRRMEARFVDPPPPGTPRLAARIENEQVLHHYYNALFRFRQFSERLGPQGLPAIERRVSLWQSTDLDLKFGLLPDLEEALQEHSTERALAVLKRIPDSPQINQNPNLGSDGIIVIPGESWHDEHRTPH